MSIFFCRREVAASISLLILFTNKIRQVTYILRIINLAYKRCISVTNNWRTNDKRKKKKIGEREKKSKWKNEWRNYGKWERILKKIVTNGLDYILQLVIFTSALFLNTNIVGYFIRNWGNRAPAIEDGRAEKGNECTAAQGFTIHSPTPFHPKLLSFSSCLSPLRNGKITTAV